MSLLWSFGQLTVIASYKHRAPNGAEDFRP